jgi:hypothetical protein
MSSVTVTEDSILARGLGVSTRVTEQVAGIAENAGDGALLETMLGRYVLDREGRAIWLLLDGRRSVGQVAEALAAARGLSAAELGAQVREFCAQLTDLRLAELVDGGGQER